ncbi:hypothetical protein C5167_044317 [Papaver somniferum]|uniref:Uncharacterized protein n=1 Tax=Papaver somniferum TaxID=3469 RepID=A0A4Y7L879_PAPSO|nr:hypothetical protein C5167_044317 [Papaver somniferum]
MGGILLALSPINKVLNLSGLLTDIMKTSTNQRDFQNSTFMALKEALKCIAIRLLLGAQA